MKRKLIKSRPICKICGDNPVMAKARSTKDGRRLWSYRCASCKRDPYRITRKKDICELCGFKAIHKCQLDIDHINGNHKDNREENLRTLCANCHRLKTFLNRDWEK